MYIAECAGKYLGKAWYIMQSVVNVMGIEIDMLSNDVFIEKINTYLNDDKLDVIFFASADILNRAAENEKYHELVDRAELFLPGEEALLTNYKIDILKDAGMVVSCKSFGIMLENLQKQDRTIYIVTDSGKDVENLRNYCKKNQPELRIIGSCVYSEEVEDAAMVNEINSCIPDILLVDLKIGGKLDYGACEFVKLKIMCCYWWSCTNNNGRREKNSVMDKKNRVSGNI